MSNPNGDIYIDPLPPRLREHSQDGAERRQETMDGEERYELLFSGHDVAVGLMSSPKLWVPVCHLREIKPKTPANFLTGNTN